MYVGARLAYVYVRGIPAFSSQQVNVVHLTSGSLPEDRRGARWTFATDGKGCCTWHG